MIFHPPRLLGTLAGAGATLLGLALTLFALVRLLTMPPSLGSFGWGVALLGFGAFAGLAAFQTYSLRSLTYALFEGKLLIRWGPQTKVIPAGDVTSAVTVKELGVPFKVGTWWWPGHYRASGRIAGIGETRFYITTRDPSRTLLIVTPLESYAISPDDPAGFQAALDHERHAHFHVAPETRYWSLARLPFWRDHALQIMILVCIALAAILGAIVLGRFPSLPELMPIRFNALGQPLGIVDRVEVLQVMVWGVVAAVIAVGVGLVLHHRDRVAAYISVAGGIGVQALFLIAAIRIVG